MQFDDHIALLKGQVNDLLDQVDGLQAAALSDERELAAEEAASVEAHLNDIEAKRAQIKRLEKQQSLRAQMEASANSDTVAAVKSMAPQPSAQPAISGGTPMVMHSGKWGFRTAGEFYQSVYKACSPRPTFDERLNTGFRLQPTNTAEEGTSAQGGYAVPPDFRREIANLIQGEESLIARTTQLNPQSMSVTLPTSETTPWGATGWQFNWTAEKAQIVDSEPTLKEVVIPLHKGAVLAPVTDELLQDAPAMESYMRSAVADIFDHAIANAILNGTGSGQPTGIIGHAGTVEVAKETLQTADTVLYENINKMWQACYAPSRANAIWIANQDVEPQLLGMVFKDDSNTNRPVYLPGNNVAGRPFDTLYGRPIIFHQACPTVGDAGDIVLADLRRYWSALRSGGIQTDVSIHLYFDYAETCFRFMIRLGGQPARAAVISALNGSATYSSFVTLAARA